MQDVAVFWDYENCPAPSNTSGFSLVNSIRSMAQNYGGIKSLKAYLGITDVLPVLRTLALRSELQSSGVSLIDCPHNGRKDVADKMMIVDMIAYAIDNAAPTTILLISGDRDFAYALSILRLRRYRIILCTPPHAHASLLAQASECIDWNDIILNSNNISSKLWAKPPSRAPIPRDPPQTFGALPTLESFREAVNAVTERCNEPGTNIPYLQSVAQGATRRRQPSDSGPNAQIGNVSAYEKPRQDTSTVMEVKQEYIRPGWTPGGQKNICSPILLSTQSSRVINTPSYIPNPVLALKTIPPNSSTPSTSYVSENSPGAMSNHIRGVSTNSIPSTSITPTANNAPLPMNRSEDMPTKDQDLFCVPDCLPMRPASAPNDYVLACPPPPPPSPAAAIVSESALSDPTTTLIDIPDKIPADDADQSSTDFQERGKPEVFVRPASDTDSTPTRAPVSPTRPADIASSDRTVAVGPISPAHTATKQRDLIQGISSHGSAPNTGNTLTMTPVPPALTAAKPLDPVPSRPAPGSDSTVAVAPISVPSPATQLPDPVQAQSHPASGTDSTLNPTKVVPSQFQILFRTLQTYKAKGVVQVLRSQMGEHVSQKGETYREAGVYCLSEYVALAEKQGIIRLGGAKEKSWIALHPDWENAGESEVQAPISVAVSSPPAPVLIPAEPPDLVKAVPPHFEILVRTLQTHRSKGLLKPTRSVVAIQIAQNGLTYKKVGVTKFSQFAALAVTQGIVELGGREGDAWISLKPEWHNAIIA